jgi:ribonuclease R
MQKAKYSPDNLGHFGLSEKNYCHFTSPIRRYPDLTIHRIIKDFLAGELNLEAKYSNFVEEASKQSSLKERNAQEAERAVDDYYKIMYISNYVGEEFSAVVSGVTNFGVFCELENGIEGLCKLETLKGKRYTFDEKSYSLSNGRETYKLGQSVKIKVAGVDFAQKKAEFLIVE